ncbi:UDP-2,3-diacylglucosamine diphosphatase [Pantoea sp. Mhis]|uniref:UDP-2,3-diacylglucosamine diphosphatase n=1 Tax=Pantoea sp. Mhis TaxID=2576759 RepID=UPI0013571DA6|nr:UDP-2,3-diacylglucosamine diphosphatase [Pantoea sp. Mhis]MXP56260.1 UDP-2,3-diacylglucosamine diphosphatase [Pantoea sp. Mhis]
MSYTLFIADVHLSQYNPDTADIFLHFLQKNTHQCDALYLLGDLFESWIGDDNDIPLYKQIAYSLKHLPIPKFFTHGNRDFLLGTQFARESDMVILPEEKVLNLYGQRVLIMHGDTLCTHDISYQNFRKKTHQKWLQYLFLSLPICIRMHIASHIRCHSNKLFNIIDVNQQSVEEVMIRQRVNMLIHGHTHVPGIHDFYLEGKAAKRIVLGNWYKGASIIQFDINGVNLIKYSF